MSNSTTNSTSLDPSDYCTLSICPLSDAYVNYVPSLPGNIFYLAVFSALLIAQLILGIRYRTWGYLTGLFGGLLLEIIGYAGRIQMHYNPFKFNPYLEYALPHFPPTSIPFSNSSFSHYKQTSNKKSMK